MSGRKLFEVMFGNEVNSSAHVVSCMVMCTYLEKFSIQKVKEWCFLDEGMLLAEKTWLGVPASMPSVLLASPGAE
jgi:hypothetical protein